MFPVAPAASVTGDDFNKTRQTIMITGIVVGSAALLIGFTIFLVWKKRKPETVDILEPRGTSKEICVSNEAFYMSHKQ